MILDIQRMSTEDGPGLRTTVFFKGCNLSCAWCHNPESISPRPDLFWFAQKCIGCGTCEGSCSRGVITREQGRVRFNRAQCAAGTPAAGDCRRCVEACPNGAIELKGEAREVESLCGELLKDRAYFGPEGGVTLSGGEAVLQSAVTVLARLLKEAGLSVALDTAGAYDFRVLEGILPFVDLVLYDLKIFESALHRSFTGADNRLILENYRKLMERGSRVWVRTPIIEGATDSEENIAAIGRFIREAGPPEKWELCAFNNLCRDKYERLDLDWAYKTAGLTRKEHIKALTQTARALVPSAVWSGSTV
ncbi:MAG: glycyl-radical enzyme activating protein [Spirochaetaceae bacterium]|jgi:pyruvate formate lyase activating enzyme|nr:glycyl-radical enzyme activating protein [Spirochaetaceae bacterium]